MENLIDLMNGIETTKSTNEKKEMFIDFFMRNNINENFIYLHFISNTFHPEPMKLNIGDATVIEAIEAYTGVSKDKIKEFKKTFGSLSRAAEECVKSKPSSLGGFFAIQEEKLSINEILNAIQKIPLTNKVNEKISLIQSIYRDQSPETVKYLTHFILGGSDLSVGYKNKLLMSAISSYLVTDEEKVLEAYTFTNSIPNLLNVDLETNWKVKLHFPYKPQLADKTKKPIKPLHQHLDYKFDGGRLQIHVSKEKISLFTRNIEDVTNSFPEIVKSLELWQNKTGHEVILDSEVLVGSNFNDFLTRIRRIYDVEKYAQELPARPQIFDMLYVDGRDVRNLSLSERREIIKSLDLPENIEIVRYEIFKDQSQLDGLYEKAISEGFEGIMIKEDVPYKLNNRSETWIKLKPEYTVDLKVKSADFGTGRNANLYSSFLLETAEGLTIGNVGIGLTDQFLAEVNELYPDKTVIFEIKYESVQKTDKTTSGYSLRFPRVKSIRYDKSDISSLNEVLKGVNIT